MIRVVLFGSPGSGKTTFARALSARTGLPHIERDLLGVLGSQSYREAVQRVASGEQWIFDGATAEADLDLYSRADTVIVLAYPRWVVMERVVRRSLRNALVRARRPDSRGRVPFRGRPHAVTRAWTGYADRRREAAALTDRPELVGAAIIRLDTPRAARSWLESIGAPPSI